MMVQVRDTFSWVRIVGIEKFGWKFKSEDVSLPTQYLEDIMLCSCCRGDAFVLLANASYHHWHVDTTFSENGLLLK